MSKINSLRDRGVALRIFDGSRLSVVNGKDLPADIIEEIRAHKPQIIAELRQEQERVSEVILACQKLADIYPMQAKRAGVALRRWQAGECVDRMATFRECWPLTDAIGGRIDVDGQELERVLDEVFPSARRRKAAEAVEGTPVQSLDAFASVPQVLGMVL